MFLLGAANTLLENLFSHGFHGSKFGQAKWHH
jgi:hypothetical protein